MGSTPKMTSKWVYKTKRDVNGDILKHKTRLVARGFSQTAGEDYKETFAPVLGLEGFRIIIRSCSTKRLIY